MYVKDKYNLRESDFVNQKFHRLLAIKKIKKSGRCWYLCQCDCGNQKVIAGWRLKSGYTKSCGCLQRVADAYRNNDKILPNGRAQANAIISYYKRNARRRNISFELSKEECMLLMKQSCIYCGRLPFKGIGKDKRRKLSGGKKYLFNGIDRKNNDVGYTSENSVSCCSDCNYAKKDKSHSDFLKWIKIIYEHNFKENR